MDLSIVDLSSNRLGANLKPIIDALKTNSRIVSIKLSNNEISGTEHEGLLTLLVQNHPSLTHLDLSNCDSNNQYRNKIGNNGLKALVEGLVGK
mmetsp:Transcript_21122/g.20300  ORF Transcript_21122/g.20300 Transcript_21122/m.20300 type:complete len:93 (+) Transcript_21122:295-573(+)